MKKNTLMLILPFLLAACAGGHREPYPEDQPVVRDLPAFEQRLHRATDGSARFSLTSLGEVKYGSFRATVSLVSSIPSPKHKIRVFLNAVLHGNEPAGAEALVRMIEELEKNPSRHGNVSFDIVPIVNPWGWSRDIRHNRDGRDCNRDFASFRCPESLILKNFLEGKRYDLMIDLHEDPDGMGFYMYQYANPDVTVSRGIIAAVRGMKYPIEQNVNMVILKTKDGLIDAPMWGLYYMRLTRQLSMTNYLRLHNSARVYTVETPTRLEMKDRKAMHGTAVRMLLESLARD